MCLLLLCLLGKVKKNKVKYVHQNCSNLRQNIMCVIRELKPNVREKQNHIQLKGGESKDGLMTEETFE